MKNRIKYLTFIPLIAWIFLYIGIGVGLVFALNGTSDFSSNKTNSSSISIMISFCIMSAISVFATIWWTVIMNKAKELDLFSKFIFIITLNFPAYIMIKKTLQKNIEIENQEIKSNSKYKINSEEQIDYDFEMLPDWEKQIIKNKANKKKKESTEDTVINNEEKLLKIQRKIIRNYTKFVLYSIWKDKPDLTATFQITKLVNEQFSNSEINLKYINEYSKEIIKWCSFDFDELNEIPTSVEEYAKNVLVETPDSELIVAYKQDRVDITIEIKAMLNRL